MATELKLRKGTTTEHGSFTGAEAEATVDTDKNTIVVHDGQTQGGFPLATEDATSKTFDSVSNMEADAGLVEGQKVRTLGYYSPGDGGGNDYEIVAAGTGTDDGDSFIDLSGSGLQAKNLSTPKVRSLSDITSLPTLNTSALVDGQQFYRGEFWPGTGVGAVDIKWDPNEPVANHNGGTIIDPAKISELNTEDKTFGDYFEADTMSGNTGCFVSSAKVVDPYMYGAIGDWDDDAETGGDDYLPWQAALDTRSDFYGPDGSFRLSETPVVTQSNKEIKCSPNCLVYLKGQTDNGLTIRGDQSPSFDTVTSDVERNSRVVEVGDSSDYDSGDRVMIISEASVDNDQPKFGEIHIVQSTSTGQITLMEGVCVDFLVSDDAKIAKLDLIENVHINGGVWIGIADDGLLIEGGQRYIVQFSFSDSCSFKGALVRNGHWGGVQFSNSVNYEISKNTISDILSDTQGYGLHSGNATTHGKVYRNTLYNCGTAIDCGNGFDGDYGLHTYIDVSRNTVYGSRRRSISTHTNAVNYSISNNQCLSFDGGGFDSGIYTRGTNIKIDNNLVINTSSDPSARIGAISHLQAFGFGFVSITDNVVDGARDISGIVVRSSTNDPGGNRLDSCLVEGNQVLRPSRNGIYIETLQISGSDNWGSVKISGNDVIKDSLTGAGINIITDEQGIDRMTINYNTVVMPDRTDNESNAIIINGSDVSGVYVDLLLVSSNTLDAGRGVWYRSSSSVNEGWVTANLVRYDTGKSAFSNIPPEDIGTDNKEVAV